jgi:hypothetical protein
MRDSYIYGTEGYILMKDYLSPRGCELYDRSMKLAESFEGQYEPRLGFKFEINHFSDLLKSGKTESDLIPLSDTLSCIDIVETVLNNFRSAESAAEPLRAIYHDRQRNTGTVRFPVSYRRSVMPSARLSVNHFFQQPDAVLIDNVR